MGAVTEFVISLGQFRCRVVGRKVEAGGRAWKLMQH
jgi:hypothetical protein